MSNNKKQNVIFIFAYVALIFLTQCTKSPNITQNKTNEVNLAIWGNYLSDDSVKKFTESTGIKINISNYTSNEELLAKVQSGAASIDVAVPSDYMVSIMTKLNLLHELNKSALPNFTKLETSLLKQDFDPDNKFSVPFAWSTAGIAINRDLFKGKITSWKDFFANTELKGKVSLLDDAREVLAAALKSKGHSVNSTNDNELEAATQLLKEFKPKVKMFTSDTVDALVNKEIAVAQAYSTDALQAAAKTKGAIEFIVPQDGGTRAIDTLVIFKNAKNLDSAHKLINFMMSEEVNSEFVKNIWGGPVVVGVKEKLPAEMQGNKSLFPDTEVLKKFEAIRDLGSKSARYDELWTKIKVE